MRLIGNFALGLLIYLLGPLACLAQVERSLMDQTRSYQANQIVQARVIRFDHKLCRLAAQDFNANMTGSAVIPFVQSPGFATLYIKFYRTNDDQNSSAQVYPPPR